ncbi:MAG: ABC transporter permease [Acidobacteriaceae bacterium]|nr:ABC transporter permease [Acidobacteriaceae bacterium]
MQVEQELLTAPAGFGEIAPRRSKVIRPVSFSPRILVTGLKELYWYRDLLYTLTLHRMSVRYKQSALGLSWALLQPLALMLVYTAVFSLTRMPKHGDHYSLFVLAGILPWTFFQTSLSTASTGLVSHTQLITKVYFPREILPITYVLAALVDFMIASLILATMMLIYHVGVGPLALNLIPILIVEFLLATGFALVLSAVQVKFRDIGIAMPLILQLWMFGSPVVYSFADVPRRLRGLYELNPIVGVVENFRRVLIQGLGIDLPTLTYSAVSAVLIVVAAYLYFKYREATMADII